jgi:catechol 2,3-dioxygenase-like lactoylglutathione lyase family enzyme
VAQNLLVIYTERLDACRDFYAGLGLTFVHERHGDGPEHFAAVLADGLVMELYPATAGRATGRLRLGFRLPAGQGRRPGRQLLTDPDGRTVVVSD